MHLRFINGLVFQIHKFIKDMTDIFFLKYMTTNVFITGNEIWLETGSSEIFTSPNYPLNYDKGDSKEWVFCVSRGESFHNHCSYF